MISISWLHSRDDGLVNASRCLRAQALECSLAPVPVHPALFRVAYTFYSNIRDGTAVSFSNCWLQIRQKKYYVKKHAGCGAGLSLHSLHKHISITYALYALFPMERRREAARFPGFIQLKII